jgi:hypothetical protein
MPRAGIRIPQKTNRIKALRVRSGVVRDQASSIRTMGAVFADGGGIELLDDAATGRLTLLLFDEKSRIIGSRIETRGHSYLPSGHVAVQVLQFWINRQIIRIRSRDICSPRIRRRDKSGRCVFCVLNLVSGLLAGGSVPVHRRPTTRNRPVSPAPRVHGSPSAAAR